MTAGSQPSANTASAGREGGVFSLLRNRDFRRLLFADGLWWLAMWMEMLVVGWLALSITDSAWWVALLGFYRSIPLPLVGLFGTPLVERFRRRHLIVALQAVGVVSASTLAVLMWLDVIQYWHLALAALANGSAWALDWPVRRSLVPDLVGKSRIVEALTLESGLQSVTRLFGPLLAGLCVHVLGILGGLLILANTALMALLILVGMETNSRSPDPAKGVRSSLRRTREGLRYVYGHRRIFGVILITVAMNAWAFPFQSLLPVFARDVLSQGPLGLGLLGSAHGLGALVGMPIVHWGRKRWSHPRIFGWASVFACLGLVAFALSESFYLSLAILVFAGVGQAGFSIMQSSITLVEADDDMRARSMSIVVLAIGMGPFGRLHAAVMAAAWGAPLATAVMALGAGVATLAVILFLRGFASSKRVRPPPRSGSEPGAR